MRTVQKIKWSIELFSNQEDMCDFSAAVEDGGIPLDYKFLIEDQYFCEVWPQFKDDLINTPTNTLAVLSLAMYQVTRFKYDMEIACLMLVQHLLGFYSCSWTMPKKMEALTQRMTSLREAN